MRSPHHHLKFLLSLADRLNIVLRVEETSSFCLVRARVCVVNKTSFPGGPGSMKGAIIEEICTEFGFQMITTADIVLNYLPNKVANTVTTAREIQDLIKVRIVITITIIQVYKYYINYNKYNTSLIRRACAKHISPTQ